MMVDALVEHLPVRCGGTRRSVNRRSREAPRARSSRRLERMRCSSRLGHQEL